MANVVKDLGPVSAYALAVAHGFKGTEEEWATLQAECGINAQIASEAASSAKASQTASATSETNAKESQTQAAASAAGAKTSETNAANSASAAAASETAAAESEAEAKRVLASVPEDYTTLANDVSHLKDHKADAIVCDASGSVITVDDASNLGLHGLRIFGRTTQNGTPTPEEPVPLVSAGLDGSITISVGESENDAALQTLTLSTPNGLPGIPVKSGGNYTDENGQQWACDEIDLERGVYVKRVNEIDVTKFKITERINETHALFTINPFRGYLKVSDKTTVLASHVPAFHNNSAGGVAELKRGTHCSLYSASTDNIVYLVLPIETASTQEEFNAWIEAQEAAGTPLEILYLIETPIETALSDAEIAAYKAMHTNKPNTTVYNDAGAWQAVEYAADTKVYIDQKFEALAAALLS